MLETKKRKNVGLDTENKTKKVISNTLLRSILIAATILVIVPIIWTIMSSFKTTKEFYASPWALPKSFGFANYMTAFTEANMGAYFFNSILVTIIAMILSLCLSVPASYVLARQKFFGCSFIKNLFMAGLFIQPVYIIVPLFTILEKMKLLNNLFALALVYAVLSLPFSIYIMSGFMKGIAKDYEEAAMIDGCTNLQILTKIVVPLAKPGIITIMIFNFMNYWNEYAMAMTFITDADKKTLPVGLQNLMEVQKFATDWGALFAGLVIVMVPTMVIYSLVHKKLTEGVNIGGVKG
ncbi:ABC transporter permease [Clostridium perfringens]|uniref:carbohydrate ABC transporter permease n=1 Tax=Clostridium perfringens TaxID=1502 RepID=UPI000E15F721|nr:carbohydrate ABC transporter permease [Clostridium perfringens]UBK83975.1 carbohydrate ABC transporter permease [Clostridium perfringens]SUY32643.1 ABC transporter permease [Clostridium perfringens]